MGSASPDAPEKSFLSTIAVENIELEGAPVAPSSSSNAIATANNPDIGHSDKDRDTAVVKFSPPHEPAGMQSAVAGGRQGPQTANEGIVLRITSATQV